MRTRDMPRLLLIFVSVFYGSGLTAQVPLAGTVLDPSGAAVPRATITLKSASRHATTVATTSSDAVGRFQLTVPAPGRYRIEVTAGAALETLQQDIRVTAGMRPLTLQLALASVRESVEVTADDARPVIDTAANLDTTTVSGSTLEQLPVFDQDFIAALTPFLDPSAIATSGPTILVDGVEMKSAGVPKSAIAEISINDDPYSAESNRPGRGRIEIMTKPGTSDLRGSLNFTFRNSSLASTNYFAVAKPPEERRTIDGTLSGPLGSGHGSSFLLSFSRQNDNASAIVHAFMPVGVFAENVAARSANSEVAARFTHDWSEKHRASLQVNWKRSSAQNQRVGGLVLPEAGVNSVSREDDLVFNLRSILTPERLNQFQLTLEFDREPTTSVNAEPGLIVRDAFTAGGAQSTILRTESGGKINDIVTLSRKKHVIKFGVQVPNLNRRVWRDQTNRGGTFSFASLSDFTAGRPYAYVVQQGTGVASFWWREYGAFVQDQIRVTPRLQVSLGLRYDWQSSFHDRNNFAPRLSIAWGPRADSKTIVRAGAGVFYDRSGVGPVANLLLHNGQNLRSYTILNPSYPDPFANGTTLANLPVDITQLAPDIRIPHSIQYSAGIERQISKSSSVTVGYRGSRGYDLFRSVDVNVPLPPDYTSVSNPGYGHIQQIRSDGRQRSNALEISFRGRAGERFTGQAQYTFSHTSNNTGGIFWYPANQYAPPDTEWGRADFDQRHRFNLLGTIRGGRWFNLGVAAHFYSGLPYSELAGQDLFHTGLANARPDGVRRNTLEGRGTADVGVRVSHDIALSNEKGDKAKTMTVSADAFNVFNHPNFSGYVGNLRSPLFLSPTVASPGRRIQLSLSSRF